MPKDFVLWFHYQVCQTPLPCPIEYHISQEEGGSGVGMCGQYGRKSWTALSNNNKKKIKYWQGGSGLARIDGIRLYQARWVWGSYDT